MFKFLSKFSKRGLNAEELVSVAEATQIVGDVAQPAVDAVIKNGEFVEALANIIQDAVPTTPVVAAAVVVAPVLPIAPILAIAAGVLVIGCKLKARRRATSEADEQKELMNKVYAAIASLESENRERHKELLAKLDERRDSLEKLLNVEALEGVTDNDAARVAAGLEIDAGDLNRRFDLLEQRLELIAMNTETSLRLGEQILIRVSEAPTLKDLDVRLAELDESIKKHLDPGFESLRQLLQPSVETQLGLKVPRPIEGASPKVGRQYQLKYAERLVPEVIGRAAEWQWLQEFVHDEEGKFRWAVLTGKGGAGKSRMALDLMLDLPPEWRVGFVDQNGRAERMKAFRQPWPGDRPTLLVFDYVQGDTKEIIAFLKRFVENSPAAKVRVLLLDRIFRGYGFANDIESALRTHQYANEGHVKNLGGLELDDFMEVFRKAHLALKSEDASGKAHRRVRAAFEDKEQERLPLIACLAAMHAAESETSEEGADWTSESLKKWYFEHMSRQWSKIDTVQTALSMVCLSTTLGGATNRSYEWVHGGAVKGLETTGWNGACEILAVPADSDLPAYEPDPLGEYFVLQRVAGTAFVGNNDRAIRTVTRGMVEAILRDENGFLKQNNTIAALERLLPLFLNSELQPVVLESLHRLPLQLLRTVARDSNNLAIQQHIDLLSDEDRSALAADIKQASAELLLPELSWSQDLSRNVSLILSELLDLERGQK